jgi:hypothetical protein
MPKAVRVDGLELARLGFYHEKRHLKDSGAPFGYYQELRNAVAHFLLEQKGSVSGSLQFSSTHVYNYSAVSSVLLKYLRLELIQLRDYYEAFLSDRIHGRYPLWNPADRGDKRRSRRYRRKHGFNY